MSLHATSLIIARIKSTYFLLTLKDAPAVHATSSSVLYIMPSQCHSVGTLSGSRVGVGDGGHVECCDGARGVVSSGGGSVCPGGVWGSRSSSPKRE